MRYSHLKNNYGKKKFPIEKTIFVQNLLECFLGIKEFPIGNKILIEFEQNSNRILKSGRKS